MSDMFTPATLAERWKCSPDKIWALISTGQIVATSTAISPAARKPRWIIPLLEVERFEARRSTSARTAPDRRRKAPCAERAYF